MYRFSLRPLWLLGHLLAVSLVVLLGSLGLWQLERLDERREHNALVLSRSEGVVPLPAEGWDEGTEPSRLVFRRALVQGSYQPAKEVLVRFRSNHGLPGYHVLTPMTTTRGTIIVNRGWVPLDMGNSWPDAKSRPAAGEIEITGLLRSSQPASRFRPRAATGGSPLSVGAVNLAGLERELSVPLYPLYLELDKPESAPAPATATSSFPDPLPPPELGEGPHLAYAAQWFIFAAGAAGGWVLLVRISARRRAAMDLPEQPAEAAAQGR